jgi:hypothetical protein
MSEHVWVSTAAASSQNHFQFGWPDSYGDSAAKVELYNQLKRDFRKGAALDQTRFPEVLETRMKSDVKSKLPRKLPSYVNWTCPVLERPIVDVMLDFDLGEANFYPVKMRRLDKDQIYDQDFFILNIAVAKQTLVPEQSGAAVEEHPFAPGLFAPASFPKEDEIAVMKTSLFGPDIWVDPTIHNRFFFISDRLQAALVAAGLAEPFRLRRCRIADDQTGAG